MIGKHYVLYILHIGKCQCVCNIKLGPVTLLSNADVGGLWTVSWPNILFDVLLNFLFSTSEMMCDYYL